MLKAALSGVVLALCVACVSVNLRAVGNPRGEKRPIRRVSLAPFVNRTDAPEAPHVIRELLAEKLTIWAGLQVVELPPDLRIRPDHLDRTRAQEIAAKVKVDALLTGTVLEYEYARSGSGPLTPSIRVNVRLVTAATGSVVWAATIDGSPPLLFTNDSIPIAELADIITTRLATALSERL